MAATLAQIRGDAQALADKVNDASIGNPEWLRYINHGIESLWNKVVTCFGDAYFTAATFTLTSSSNQFTLPSTYRRLLWVERDPGLTSRRIIRRWNKGDKDFLPELRYRQMGGVLVLEPLEAAPGNYGYAYIPAPTLLASDSDQIDVQLDPWNEYVGVFAAIKGLG